MKKPSAPEQFDLKEGIEFENGFYEGVTVKKLVLYQQVIYVDTNTSTDESKRILLSLLAWAKETHGITFDPALISKWAYISDIIFRTDFPLLEYQNPILRTVASKISEEVQRNLHEGLIFSAGEFKISHDPSKRSATIASFSIQHRGVLEYEQNIFFSEAPVPTSVHLELLELVEKKFRAVYDYENR